LNSARKICLWIFIGLLLNILHVSGQEPVKLVEEPPILLEERVEPVEPTDAESTDSEMLDSEQADIEPTDSEPADAAPVPQSDIIFLSDTVPLTDVFPHDEFISSHSPAKAAIMSAVLPGLGQVYNRKYWKVPVVYLALGISVERFITFQNEFNRFRRAYIDLNDGDPYTNFHLTLFPPNTPDAQMNQWVTRGKDRYRTWRDWAIVAVVASYALNIIDANVDAHLMDFSLDDNISLKIQPTILDDFMFSKKIGLTLRLAF